MSYRSNQRSTQRLKPQQLKDASKQESFGPVANSSSKTEVNREPPPRHRIVRRPTLWARIINAPFDYLVQIQNDYESLDWDSWNKYLGFVTAIALNLGLVILKMAYGLDRPEFSSEEKKMITKSSYAFKLELGEYFFLFLSCINFFHLLINSKKYRMFQHKTVDQPLTSNAQLVDWTSNEPEWIESTFGRIIYPVYRLVFQSSDSNCEKVWELNIWDPSAFSLSLFCYYSPPQVLVIMGLESENWHYYLPVAILIGVQVYAIVTIYTGYIKDKQVLFGEVTNEYDQTFVYPTIFKPKRDVATQTDPLVGWDALH